MSVWIVSVHCTVYTVYSVYMRSEVIFDVNIVL